MPIDRICHNSDFEIVYILDISASSCHFFCVILGPTCYKDSIWSIVVIRSNNLSQYRATVNDQILGDRGSRYNERLLYSQVGVISVLASHQTVDSCIILLFNVNLFSVLISILHSAAQALSCIKYDMWVCVDATRPHTICEYTWGLYRAIWEYI